jgi:hypothetical protein
MTWYFILLGACIAIDYLNAPEISNSDEDELD